MTKTENAKSAKIYQFPEGGRAGLVKRDDAKAAAEAATHLNIVVGGSWYHDEAIQEASNCGKR